MMFAGIFLKVLALLFGNYFVDFSFFKFTKSKYFFNIKIFRIFFERMVFKVS